MTKRDMIMNAVESLGYKPQTDEDGDVFIRYQMKTICIIVGPEDEAYVMVLLPQFAEIDEGETTLALAICNKMTRDIKLAKVYIDQTLKNVSANCGFFYTDEECLKNNLGHVLKILGMIRSAYYNTKAELSE